MNTINILRVFLTSAFGFTNILCFSDLRFNKKISVITVALLTIASSISISLLSYYSKSFLHNLWLLMYFIQLGVIVGAGFLLGKHNGFRTLSSVAIAAVYNQIGAILTLSFARIIPNKIVMLFLYAAIYCALCCLAFFIVRKSLIMLMRLKTNGWYQLFLLALFVYIIMLVIVPLPSSGNSAPFNIIAGIMLSLSIIWVFIFLRNELKQSKLRSEIEKSKHSIEFQVEKLEHQVIQMELNEKNLSVLRHDLKHNFLILAQLTANKDFDGCTQMLANLEKSVSLIETSAVNTKFCKNRYINAIVSSYTELYQFEHINLNVEILLSNPDRDIFLELAVVIGNCLDNALNAAKAVLKANAACPTIKLRCYPAGEQMFLEVINPFVGQIVFDKKTGMPLSFKEGHGIGSASTKAFSEKYNAHVSWAIESENFVTRIVF